MPIVRNDGEATLVLFVLGTWNVDVPTRGGVFPLSTGVALRLLSSDIPLSNFCSLFMSFQVFQVKREERVMMMDYALITDEYTDEYTDDAEDKAEEMSDSASQSNALYNLSRCSFTFID